MQYDVAGVNQYKVDRDGKQTFATGSNKSVGTAVLVAGTATVSNTKVTASSQIWVQYATGVAPSIGAGTLSVLTVGTVTAGTSFVINGLTAAGVLNPADNSTVQWWT